MLYVITLFFEASLENALLQYVTRWTFIRNYSAISLTQKNNLFMEKGEGAPNG